MIRPLAPRDIRGISGRGDVEVVVDSDEVQQMLAAFNSTLSPSSLGRFLDTYAVDMLQARTRERFAGEGDSASGRWAELKPVTEDIRGSMGFPRAHPINERTGQLKRWLLSDGGLSRRTSAGASVTWPGPAPSAKVEAKLKTAQLGSEKPVTVQRPVVAIDEMDLTVLLGLFNSWMHREVSFASGAGPGTMFVSAG